MEEIGKNETLTNKSHNLLFSSTSYATNLYKVKTTNFSKSLTNVTKIEEQLSNDNILQIAKVGNMVSYKGILGIMHFVNLP